MKRTILFFLTAIIITSTCVCCCNCRSHAKLARPLVGTQWQLVQIMGRDVTPTGESYTLLFHADGTITGVGDCNRLTATYSVTESRALKIENLGATRRLCPDFEAENAYFDMLEGVTHYEMDAANMLLLSDGTLVAIMKAVNEE
ncbi:MAG: META domain-containing protein [Alistipes sp.]|nr:META domain-containing protein [Alistipes sp.]